MITAFSIGLLFCVSSRYSNGELLEDRQSQTKDECDAYVMNLSSNSYRISLQTIQNLRNVKEMLFIKIREFLSNLLLAN